MYMQIKILMIKCILCLRDKTYSDTKNLNKFIFKSQPKKKYMQNK